MSSPNQLSFLPEDYLETKRQRRTNVICAALFLVVMAGVGASFTWVEKSLRTAEKDNTETGKRFAEAASRIEQEKQMEEKQAKMNAQAELTASLLEKVPRSVLLAELTNAKPQGLSFLDLSLESKLRAAGPSAPSGGGGGGGAKSQFEIKRAAMEAATGGGGGGPKNAVPAPQAKLYDVTIKVTGIADNDSQVAKFMSTLNHSKLLKDVNLVISDEFVVSEVKMRKFQVEMSVDPNAEVTNGTATLRNGAAALELK
jgi:Tfp pilus assembly protein PilN